MKELSPEVQAAIIMSASDASIEAAEIQLESKKNKKNFNQLFAAAFEKNYNKLMDIVVKPEIAVKSPVKATAKKPAAK
jgi:hypothetical protein